MLCIILLLLFGSGILLLAGWLFGLGSNISYGGVSASLLGGGATTCGGPRGSGCGRGRVGRGRGNGDGDGDRSINDGEPSGVRGDGGCDSDGPREEGRDVDLWRDLDLWRDGDLRCNKVRRADS